MSLQWQSAHHTVFFCLSTSIIKHTEVLRVNVKWKRKSAKTMEVWNKEFPLVMLCSAPQGAGSIRGNVLAILSLVAAYLWEHCIRYWNKFTIWTEPDKTFCGIVVTHYKRYGVSMDRRWMFLTLTLRMQKK